MTLSLGLFQHRVSEHSINLQATKLFIVASATKGVVVVTHPSPIDLVFGSKYCIV